MQKMRLGRLNGMLALAGAFLPLALYPDAAQAQAQTVGGLMNNIIGATSKFPPLLSALSYTFGVFLSVQSMLRFKAHVDNPSQTPISDPVKRFLAGGLFLSLPFMLSVLRGTLFGSNGVGSSSVNASGFTNASLSQGGLDWMVVTLIGNINKPLTGLLGAFGYISAIGLLLVGISRLTKRMEDGPRGPGGIGTLMTFIVAGALFSFADSIGTFVSTIFGSSTLKTHAQISSAVITGSDAQKIQTVIEGLLIFITLVGYIAFMRGLFVMKGVADGQQGATLAQSLTFLFGGALAINLGGFIQAIATTLNITALQFL